VSQLAEYKCNNILVNFLPAVIRHGLALERLKTFDHPAMVRNVKFSLKEKKITDASRKLPEDGDMKLSRNAVFLVAFAVFTGYAVYWLGAFSQANATRNRSDVSAIEGRGIAKNSAPVVDGRSLSRGFEGTVSTAQQPWNKMTISKAELEAQPNFWMFAYSESDKVWLEQHGYPTMDQEARLGQAGTESLRALADAGDLNASVHVGVRYAQAAIDGSGSNAFPLAKSYLTRAVVEGGPYQSAKTVAFFAELAKNKQALGALDTARLKGLQDDLLPVYELARGVSEAYGDAPAVRAFNSQRDIGLIFGLPATAPVPFDYAMRRLSLMNRDRERRGLPPYNFIQRPSPPGSTDILSIELTNTVYSR
jgi:hypothetical protein